MIPFGKLVFVDILKYKSLKKKHTPSQVGVRMTLTVLLRLSALSWGVPTVQLNISMLRNVLRKARTDFQKNESVSSLPSLGCLTFVGE